MKKYLSALFALLALVIPGLWPASSIHAQDNNERLTVSFTDASKPGLLKVNFINGAITVKSYSGKDVLIESKSAGRDARIKRLRQPVPSGLRRIDSNAAALSVEEENNVMTVTARSWIDSSDLEIQVPLKTNLNLRTLNGGDIVVEGVEGEIEVTNTNGAVLLNNVAGSVIAHATNGKITASLRQITPSKPMSFTSMNANVDITLPTDAKANLKMRTDNGETYSDFDIQLRPGPPPTVEDSRNRGGRYRVETSKTIVALINGGGPDFDVRTLNGNIYIRKAK